MASKRNLSFVEFILAFTSNSKMLSRFSGSLRSTVFRFVMCSTSEFVAIKFRPFSFGAFS